MQYFAFLITLLAFLGASQPIRESEDESWLVKSFSSYVAPHSISQITAFSLVPSPANATAGITCSNATGAALSATPYLVPVVDGDCAPGSGFNFSFRQLAGYAVELTVVQAASNRTATYTSGNDSVTTVKTGPGPFDTLTSYVGENQFALEF
ncbi:hypothetical protein SLS62_004887 [Diatrype stigma]|uniref:Uncharacterized protein n=1 Tax=Diatrype stigma TaxID=117547 RepID=A0AAN9YSZ3_9PEZI